MAPFKNSMPIPDKCSVLVVGGGPGGSYTASVLAREGIDTVVLEGDIFPRYHIGESNLPSFRHYLKFIDLDDEFDKHGFTKKVGAAFKMSKNRREGFTNFLTSGGLQDNYSWNVVRSEADEMLFLHAGRSGAKIFDGVKVDTVNFVTEENESANGTAADSSKSVPNPGRPVSATYTRKTGSSGTIKFDYIVDATGRAGLLSTKYLKNRHYNKALKNIATWTYFQGTKSYKEGTPAQNSVFNEALQDESGWVWFIPLHDGTTSVGVVMDQSIAAEKKAAAGSTQQFYDDALKLTPTLLELIGNGKQVAGLKTASDYSYSANSYSFPYARIVGDAGCFIDPFFSSGVHLALTAGLAAGTTIAASIRGDCAETEAAKWHSNKVREAYARFLLAVLSAYKQMRNQDYPVMSDFDEDNFDRAFNFIKPIIQGTADVNSKITQAEFAKTIDFLAVPFSGYLKTRKYGTAPPSEPAMNEQSDGLKPLDLSDEDKEALEAVHLHWNRNMYMIESFTTDIIDGRIPRLEVGNLTLVPVTVE